MLAVVGAFTEHELVIVTGELERGRHVLIRERPVAELIVEIIATILKEDAQGLLLRLANHGGIHIAATNVGEGTDVADHLAEGFGMLPGDGESADAAGTAAGDGALLGISGEVVALTPTQLLLQQ